MKIFLILLLLPISLGLRFMNYDFIADCIWTGAAVYLVLGMNKEKTSDSA